MPFIPFPDIPKLPGVPAIPRSSTAPTPPINPVSTARIPNNAYTSGWGFIEEAGDSKLIPDSFIDFEYREERKIPNYPVEGGGFSSYNKVALPFDVRVTVSCNGNGIMSKENFLYVIEQYINSLTLLSVITPNFTYNNCNLIHVDYRREAKQGVSLIIAQLWFQEVKIAQAAVPTTTEPSGAVAENNGQVSPITYNPSQPLAFKPM